MPDATTLREQLAGIPTGPGVYIYRDAADRVLYVGKAKSLRRRVHSYFQAPLRPDESERPGARMRARSGLHPKIAEMVERVARVEVFVTSSESEALILEANLVKLHRPPFNVRLRDDKSYPYIAISLDEEYPRVYFTRERHRRDRMYFGPFSNAYKVRDTLSLIGRIFPSRPCEGPEPGRPSGVPCLDYHIKRCLAPCVGYISKEDYRALIDQIIDFLSGRYRGLEQELEAEMRAAAAAQEFERAAVIRNRLSAVRHLMERQFAHADSVGTADVLGVALEGDSANVQVLQVRDGVLQDRQSFFLDAAGAEDEDTVLVQFAYEFYSLALAIPPLVVVAQDSGAAEALEARADRAPRAARRGARGGARRQAQAGRAGRAQRALRPRPGPPPPRAGARTSARRAAPTCRASSTCPRPRRGSSAYDISNLGETYAVASMVVFEGGAPAKAHYRTFTMRDEAGQDDFARIREAVRAPLQPPGRAGRGRPVVRGPAGSRGDRRRQGPAVGGARGDARRGGGGRPGREPRQAPGGGVPPGPPRPAAARRGLVGAARAAAHPRRGPPFRAAPPPRPPRPRHDRERPRRPARASGRRARRRCCATSARPSASWRPAARSWRRCRGCRRRWPATSTTACTRPRRAGEACRGEREEAGPWS